MTAPTSLLRLARASSSLLPARSTLLRPALVSAFPPRPNTPSTPTSAFHSSVLTLKKSAKQGKPNKNKVAKEEAEEFEEEEVEWSGKGKKGKGKGKLVSGHGREIEEEVGNHQVSLYELSGYEKQMDEGVDRMRVGLKTVVGRVGRVSPDLLDKIRVDDGEGQKRPLNEFASVSVQGGKDLIVTVYQEDFLKPVSSAIFASPLSLAPQPTGATTLRVPIPRADWDKRQQLVKQANDLAENAKIAIRQVRIKAQKEIKAELEKEEGRAEAKKLDDATKKRTTEVDKIFEQAKQVLMDE